MLFRRKNIRSLFFCFVSVVLMYLIIIISRKLKVHWFRIRDTTGVTTCNNCFPHDFKYVINNENICKTTSVPEETIELIIIIFTEHGNYKAREAIRNTWLTYTKNNTANIRYAFLLGTTGNDSDNERIVQENSVHKDILKEDFLDTYRNLTYKTIMGFKWIVTYCARAKFVLKTDDDMFINVPKFSKFLQESGKILHKNLVGACIENGRPIRNVTSKWYMPEELYKERNYAGFCSGTGYLTSIEIVKKLYNISPSVPYLHLEDVYVGLCLKIVGGHVKTVYGFMSILPDQDPCIYKGDRVFTAHHKTPEMLNTIWTSQCEKSNLAIKPLFSWISWFTVLTFYIYTTIYFTQI